MIEPGFEARLARGIREMADTGTRPFDARAVAETVVATRRGHVRLAQLLVIRKGRRWIALAAAAVLLLALLGLALALAGSHQPPTNERLAFVRSGDLWVAAGDGGAARLLVAHDPADQEFGYMGVQMSPDTTRLAAVLSLRPGGTCPEPARIAILTSDGRSLATFPAQCGPTPVAWSPDGTHLAVFGLGGLSLLDRQGRFERALDLPAAYHAADPKFNLSVTWSPDSRWVAITGCVCNSANNGAWLLAVDGSAAREVRVPGGGNAMSLAWSPDAARLAIGVNTWTEPFHVPDGPHEVWVVNVDGGSAERVATADEALQVSGWSPDGTWIAYTGEVALRLVHPDGSGTPLEAISTVGPFGPWATPWSTGRRVFYLVGPQAPASATPADLQSRGSIMVLDPGVGHPALAIDHVDFAQFDVH
jgi:dipeptidyl aminopeptidase/acylaminoacyl peptidase